MSDLFLLFGLGDSKKNSAQIYKEKPSSTSIGLLEPKLEPLDYSECINSRIPKNSETMINSKKRKANTLPERKSSRKIIQIELDPIKPICKKRNYKRKPKQIGSKQELCSKDLTEKKLVLNEEPLLEKNISCQEINTISNMSLNKKKPKWESKLNVLEDIKRPFENTNLEIGQEILSNKNFIDVESALPQNQSVDCSKIDFKKIVNKFQSKILENESKKVEILRRNNNKRVFLTKQPDILIQSQTFLKKSLVKELCESFSKQNNFKFEHTPIGSELPKPSYFKKLHASQSSIRSNHGINEFFPWAFHLNHETGADKSNKDYDSNGLEVESSPL